jgi:HSP20 family protein
LGEHILIGVFLLLLKLSRKIKDLYRLEEIMHYMGIGGYMARELVKELDSRSRDFYEFVMPAIDMVEDGNDLVVTIDLPGFAKKDINLRITGNVLSIMAKREQAEILGTVYYRHRPLKIDKKVLLPISVKEEEKAVGEGKATYENGVVTLKLPMTKSTNIPIIS